MSRGTKPTDLNYIVNIKKFQEFRRRAGLNMKAVQEAVGISPPNLCDFEHGRIMLQLHHIRELIRLYGLDLFEAHDVLRLRLFDGKLIRNFRRACREVGTTPAQALRDFLLVFTAEVRDDR